MLGALYIVALSTGFTPPGKVDRRTIVSAAAAVAASTFLPAPSHANRDIFADAAKYATSAVNTEGDAAVYTPKLKVEAGGQKSTRLVMKMPDPGPLSARDYVDVMYLRDSKGSILAAGEFRADGKGIKEQVEGVKKAAVEPKFQGRIDAGTGEVTPGIHTSKGYVWEGKSVAVP